MFTIVIAIILWELQVFSTRHALPQCLIAFGISMAIDYYTVHSIIQPGWFWEWTFSDILTRTILSTYLGFVLQFWQVLILVIFTIIGISKLLPNE